MWPIVMTMPSTAATMPRPGSASPIFVSADDGLQRLVVMHREVFVHQRLEVVRRDAADDDHLGGVGQEVDGLVAGEELRIAREDRALARILEVRFERHHARLLHQLEDLKEHRQQIDVVLLRCAGAGQRALDLPDAHLQHFRPAC